MKRRRDKLESVFRPAKDRSFQAALTYRIAESFPRIGGPRIVRLCAKMIREVVQEHLRPKDHLRPGQILYNAVSIDDPPARGKTMAETEQVTVTLKLVTQEDIEKRLAAESGPDRLLRRAKRLCQQAYQQGGVLSNIDLALLLGYSPSYVGQVLSGHERESGKLVPRRANVHDVGTGQTHKRIICLARHRDGKSAAQIARETYHSHVAVDRYLSDFARVRFCLQKGMERVEIRQALEMSDQLINQYMEINEELEDARS